MTTCRAALERWQREELGRLSAKLYALFEGDDVAAGLAAFSAELADLVQENENCPSDGFDLTIREALGTVRMSVSDDHPALSALRWMVRNLAREMYETISRAVATCSVGRPPSDGAAPSIQPRGLDASDTDRGAAQVKDTSAPSIRLSVLTDAYLRHCDATDEYAAALRMYVRRLTESLGEDRLVDAITKRDIVQFLEQISEIPARLNARERDMVLPDLVAQAKVESARNPRPRLQRRTIEKWMACFSAVFRYGRSYELCPVNPVEGISLPRKKAVEPARQHFEPEELAMIFGSPLYRGHACDPYRCQPGPHIIKDEKYWLPLLALFTGCRRNEMAQARTTDIKEADGIAFLHITTAVEDDGRQKHLKTAASRRMIPLHRTLIDHGFLQYVDEIRAMRNLYLFPNFDQSSRKPADAFGKWFDRFCSRLAAVNGVTPGTGIDAPSRTFHSFRHTFKRGCRDAEIGKDVHDELSGHAGPGDVGSSYGRTRDGRFSLGVLNAAIQRLQFSTISNIA